MRILFTTLAEAGHFHPLVPIARAAIAAGHEIAFACSPSFVPTVEATDFRAFSAGFDPRNRTPSMLFPSARAFPEAERTYWIVPNIFAGTFAVAMLTDLLSLGREWPPDLIVRASGEFGGCVAAETFGIPHASVRTDATSSTYSLRSCYGAPLAVLRERCGLPLDSDVVMPFRYLHLACEPPRFVRAGESPAPTAHLLRPVNFESGEEKLPPWVANLSARPTVYATLGTHFSRSPSGVPTFRAILDALRGEPINLILTVGRDTDPTQFGPQPENVHIARFIPQSALLTYCDLVVQQGGFSTITGALNAGLPMVILPIGADQPYNATCCAALGVGRVVAPDERTPEAIRAAVRAVLADPTYRANAQRVRDEMTALPGPEHAVELLERLVAEQQPLLTE